MLHHRNGPLRSKCSRTRVCTHCGKEYRTSDLKLHSSNMGSGKIFRYHAHCPNQGCEAVIWLDRNQVRWLARYHSYTCYPKPEVGTKAWLEQD